MLARLMFMLLPVQILLAAIGAVNGIVSGYFASNYIGVEAMTAVGIYGPIGMIVTTTATILTGGSSILCGKYMGQNRPDKMHNIFTLDLLVTGAIGALFTAALLVLSIPDLTGFLSHEPEVRALLNQYIIGQAVGIIPYLIGSQLTIFLSIENRSRLAMTASVSYIIANLVFNILFVSVLRWEVFGLALASSAGMWVFFLAQAGYFISGRSQMRFRAKSIIWSEVITILVIGFPGAATNVYQILRGLTVNRLLETCVGGIGISAFTACNNFLGLFWAIPAGFVAVSRMITSVSIGEEDRQTLTDVMRVMFTRFVPIMTAIALILMALAVPETKIFYKDQNLPVFMMTVNGFRLLPLAMPLSVVAMHFNCYGQASGKQALINLISFMDGFVCVAAFSAILIPVCGINGLYYANILNGIVIILLFFAYACIKNRKIPSDMDELMVIPENFGAPETDRMDMTIRNIDEVVNISQRVESFCLDKGVDKRRAFLSGLAMEEMAGNIVEHGFEKDERQHTVDVRVVYKDDNVILRLRDDCTAFDPGTFSAIADGDDAAANIGIRMIFGMIKNIEYQNILGLNVLTMSI